MCFPRHIALTGAKAARGPPEEGSFQAAVQAVEAEHRGDEWIDVVDFDDVNDSESQSAAAVLACGSDQRQRVAAATRATELGWHHARRPKAVWQVAGIGGRRSIVP
mgnify:CR=1 FL=1